MRLGALAVGMLGALLYTASVYRLGQVPHRSISSEMQVALPRFIQVALTGGDRYLAANIATWRSLVASTEFMEKDNYAIQARLQRDAAWLNPGQEDNYYIAAAILPWVGELDAAQDVLWRASEARPFDWLPIFYYAFNVYQFNNDSARAAKLMHEASRRPMSENDHYMFEQIAASWYEKGYSAEVALGVVRDMAQKARSSGFRKFLEVRAGRLQTLIDLRTAAATFRQKEGRPLRALTELVDAGIISAIPADPFGRGFELDESGEPVFKRPRGARR